MQGLRFGAVFALPRRSLLVQLLGVYLLFVALVIGIDLKVNEVARQQVISQFQSSDLALAQEIALDTDSQLSSTTHALRNLSSLAAVQHGNVRAMVHDFRAFKAARSDLDLVYWLGPDSSIQVSVPSDLRTLGATFANQALFRRAVHAPAGHPMVQDGIVDLTTFNAVLTILLPVRVQGRLVGVLGANLKLDDLNQSFGPVVTSQGQHGQHLRISILDNEGRLIGTDELERLLQPAVSSLPGAAAALAGRADTRVATDTQGVQWLYASVPVPSVRWAVVVQRSASDALGAVSTFQRWITIAAALFAVGGLLFWLVLLLRVVRPLRFLAGRYSSLSMGGTVRPRPALSHRKDEMGALARSLRRMEHDVEQQLAELHTLLETSSAVVTSLDPTLVGRTIIQGVQRLVDIQAAAVFVPDEEGVLRVLVSEGRGQEHDQAISIRLDDLSRPPALALHERHPVQRVAGEDSFPEVSAQAGFGALLALPIISRGAGGVVLVVHRVRAQRFSEQDVELLLTFANHAALAWEHAVLYERSDERLRQIARENEDLYREAAAERGRLAAIMESMTDGLILTGVDGAVLYANPGAGAIIGWDRADFNGAHIGAVHHALLAQARDPEAYAHLLTQVQAGERLAWILESERSGAYCALNLRLFDVHDDQGTIIGRGLLLSDITRERELDQFKTTLLGAVGHELRTPLAAIKGYASTLLQNDVTWSAGEQTRFLETISTEADRLAQLVSNILDLSRLEAGLLPLHREPCRPTSLVSAAVQRMGHDAAAIRICLPHELPEVDVDRARIEVVIHNLLANALAYGNGRVEVSAVQEREAVVLSVSDNGPGIAPEDLPRIFERFYRAGQGQRQRSSGTGLGLAISRAFVTAHGGRIWAQSSEDGTVISFSLPTASTGRTPRNAVLQVAGGGS